MKRLFQSTVALCAVAPLLAFSAEPATNKAAATPNATAKLDALFGDTIVAKGQGVNVTRAQLDEALVGLKSRAAASGQTIPPAQMNMFEQQILQRLIQVQILNSRATDADKTAGKEQTDKRMAEIKARAGTDENLESQLRSVGLTRSELVSRMTEEATAEAVLKREVKPAIKDEDVKKYYDENKARFEQPELVRVAHVLLSTKDPEDNNPNPAAQKDLPEDKKQAKRKQAEDVLKRARAGEDFKKLAKELSEDPGVKENDGEYVFSEADPFVPEFKKTAFSLTNNQVSDIVTTEFGYHVLKLYQKIPGAVASLDDEIGFLPTRHLVIKKNWTGDPDALQSTNKLSSLIREKLESDQMQESAPEFLAKLQKEAKVEILDERLKPEPEPAATPAPKPPVK